MHTRPLEEWATDHAHTHGLDAFDVEAAARRELAWRSRLDGIEYTEIHTWLLTEAAARSLLANIDYTR
jgi:hypothetical protein